MLPPTCRHTHVTREVTMATRRRRCGGPRRRWSSGPALQRTPRATDVTRNWSCRGCLFGYFRRQLRVVEIIIAELHCLSNGGHCVDCSASYVRNCRRCTKWDRRNGLTKNRECLVCSGSGTKNVPRPDRTDVVPDRNSIRNSSGSISINDMLMWVQSKKSIIARYQYSVLAHSIDHSSALAHTGKIHVSNVGVDVRMSSTAVETSVRMLLKSSNADFWGCPHVRTHVNAEDDVRTLWCHRQRLTVCDRRQSRSTMVNGERGQFERYWNLSMLDFDTVLSLGFECRRRTSVGFKHMRRCQRERYINLRLLTLGLLVYTIKYGGALGLYHIISRYFVQYCIISIVFPRGRIVPSPEIIWVMCYGMSCNLLAQLQLQLFVWYNCAKYRAIKSLMCHCTYLHKYGEQHNIILLKLKTSFTENERR